MEHAAHLAVAEEEEVKVNKISDVLSHTKIVDSDDSDDDSSDTETDSDDDSEND